MAIENFKKTIDEICLKYRFIDKYSSALHYLSTAIEAGKEYIELTNDFDAKKIIKSLEEALIEATSCADYMDRLEDKSIVEEDFETDEHGNRLTLDDDEGATDPTKYYDGYEDLIDEPSEDLNKSPKESEEYIEKRIKQIKEGIKEGYWVAEGGLKTKLCELNDFQFDAILDFLDDTLNFNSDEILNTVRIRKHQLQRDTKQRSKRWLD